MSISNRVSQFVPAVAKMEAATRAHEFVALARAIALGDSERAGTAKLVNIAKTGVAAGTTVGDAWAGELSQYNLIAQGFLNTLSGYSVFDKVAGDGAFARLPMHTRAVVNSIAGLGGTPGESHPFPVTKFSLTAGDLVERVSSAFIVVSDELLKTSQPGALTFLLNELKKSLARTVDAAFLDLLVSDTGVTSNQTTGTSAAQFAADISLAAKSITTSSNSRVYLAASPAVVKEMALVRTSSGDPGFPGLTLNGGSFGGITVVPSDSLSTSAVMFGASQIVVDVGSVTLERSTQSAVQLDDAPSDGAAELTSLWQANLKALMAKRYWAALPLASDAIATITGYSVTA